MKGVLIVATVVGALISAALLVLESQTGFSGVVMDWEWPGISAAYLFWGAVGGSASTGIAIAWLVNAIVYGAAAFAVLIVFNLMSRAPLTDRK
jgi:hypothetical protein